MIYFIQTPNSALKKYFVPIETFIRTLLRYIYLFFFFDSTTIFVFSSSEISSKYEQSFSHQAGYSFDIGFFKESIFS